MPPHGVVELSTRATAERVWMAVAASVASVLRSYPSSGCGCAPAPPPSARWMVASWATGRTAVVPQVPCPHARGVTGAAATAGPTGQVQAGPRRSHGSHGVGRRTERPATGEMARPRAAEIETEDVYTDEYTPARVPTAQAVARMREELRDAALRARRKNEKVLHLPMPFHSPVPYTHRPPLRRRRKP